jgi:peptidoglycan/LPS O-acetylase OafA/YrhL
VRRSQLTQQVVMQPEKKPREGFLDGLRFIAAFAVLLFHYGFRGHEADNLSLSFPELSTVVRYGYLGVQLFFMISGYVILWSIEGRTLQYFTAHRLIRLYPTFWFCAIFTLFIEHLTKLTRFYPSFRTILVNITMTPSWFGFPAIDGSYWSLATEMQFYILVGFSVWRFGFERIGNVLLLWLLAGSVLYYFNYSTFGGAYFAYFCIGAACYLLNSEGLRPKYVALLVGSLSAALLICTWEAPILGSYYKTHLDPVVCAGIVILETLLVLLSYRISSIMGRRANQLAIYLGGVTYPLYLIHQTAGYSIMNTYFTQTDKWLAICTTTLLMLAISIAIYVYFDRPVRAMLKKIANIKMAITEPRSAITDRRV